MAWSCYPELMTWVHTSMIRIVYIVRVEWPYPIQLFVAMAQGDSFKLQSLWPLSRSDDWSCGLARDVLVSTGWRLPVGQWGSASNFVNASCIILPHLTFCFCLGAFIIVPVAKGQRYLCQIDTCQPVTWGLQGWNRFDHQRARYDVLGATDLEPGLWWSPWISPTTPSEGWVRGSPENVENPLVMWLDFFLFLIFCF